MPEVVKTDSRGYKSVAYSNIVPVLIEALKTQQQTIKESQSVIKELQTAISKLQSTVKTQSQAISALQK